MSEKTAHILLVEDEEAHIKLIRRAFESKTGEVNLTVARNLREARARLAEFTPDLVLADWQLPDGVGMELLPPGKGESPYPVVILTAHGNERIAVEAMKAGALDYVVKSSETLADMPHIAERALREWNHIVERRRSEGELRKLFQAVEQSPASVIITDTEGTIEYVNPKFTEITGYTAQEVIGKNPRVLKSGEFPPEKYKELWQTIKAGEAWRGEFHNKKKNGELFWEFASISAIRNPEGKITHFLAVKEDITERKQIEEELQESETRFRTIVENAVDGILVIDEYGIVKMFNSAAQGIFGYSPSEILGRNISILMPEPYRGEHDGYLEKYRETGKAKIIGIGREVIACRKDGSEFDMDVSVSELNWHGAKVFLGITRDISDRKELEKKLEKYANDLEKMVEGRTKALNNALQVVEDARNRMDAILKSIGDGLIVTDIENRVVLMNKAAEEIFSVSFKDAMGKEIEFIIKDKNLRDGVMAAFQEKPSSYKFDFELPGYDFGHSRIFRAGTSIILDKEGKKTGKVTIMHDVTQERELDKSKSEFMSTAAHELRTPLTSIRGFSELLLIKDNLKPEEKTELLSYINEESVHLINIINDLLDISRIESGEGFSLKKAPCDIKKLFQNVIPLFRKYSDKHQFEEVWPQEEIQWVVDKEKMEQVLKNIYSNAIKYSPQGGLIKTTVNHSKEEVEISIEDWGIGMTPEHVEKIFEKFYRADSSNTAVEGTGLGTTIIKHIVEAHGGRVWVESEHGKGTTVNFTVPLSKEY